jgi:hypothetical protein
MYRKMYFNRLEIVPYHDLNRKSVSKVINCVSRCKRQVTITHQFEIMNKKFSILLFSMLFIWAGVSFAQYDDLYYDPAQDVQTTAYADDYALEESYNSYDDEYYDDEYDYYYTSRLRRFYRPFSGFNYYSPIYVDLGYYDPFFFDYYRPGGLNIYVGIGSYSYSRWNRYAWSNPWRYRWSYNNYRPWNSWGYYYGDPFYSNYGYSSWRAYGCPPSWGYGGVSVVNTNIVNVNNVNTVGTSRGTYYGPRTTGITRTNVLSPRVKALTAKDDIATTRNTRSIVSRRPGSSVGTVGTANPRARLTPSSRTKRSQVDRRTLSPRSRTMISPRSNDRRTSIYDRSRSSRNPDLYKPRTRVTPRSYTPSRSLKPIRSNRSIDRSRSGSSIRSIRPSSSGSSINRSTIRSSSNQSISRGSSSATKSKVTSPRKKN